MNISRLSWQNLISNPLNTTLSLLLMMFGVGIISLLFLLNNQIEQQLQANLKGVDMVVGSKGSPLQLILSSIYHIDNPTGNIPYSEAIKIENNSLVDFTIPLSYGDSYNGFRIVGTSHQYPELYEMSLNKGRLWSRNLEVVIGSTLAQIYGLKIGDTFYGSHGLIEGGHVHDEYAYEVVGIFNPSYTILDQLILTNTQSVWQVHHHEAIEQDHEYHEEESAAESRLNSSIPEDAMITCLLVKFKSPIGLIQLPRKINETTNLQAAVPAIEISRLTNLLGFGIQTINIIAFIIIIVSGLSIFISLYNSLKKRRYELALMRVHGASKWQLVQLVLQEGIILSVIGTVFGLFISRITVLTITLFAEHKHTFSSFQYNLLNEELWLFPIALLIGIVASIIPTILSYNINIPKILSNE
ncbi:MAG: ABC transporter permease [Bacteroidota bacterium]|nr:ABC transporter permease [Bacteroidota bacterium]